MKRYEQQMAEICGAIETIKKRKNVSDGEYNELQFEYGCLFAEWYAGVDGYLREMLLKDESVGYWDWWRSRWRLDDMKMIKYEFDISYAEAKMWMCESNGLDSLLTHYLEFKGII